MNKKAIFPKFLFIFITGLFIFLLYYFWGGVTKPELEVEPIVYSPEKLREQEELWDYSFSEEDLYAVQRNVDYAEGTSGAWYPKREARILAELVQEGKLPPVAERVGPEPVVIEGVDGIGNYGGTWNIVTNSAATLDHIEAWMAGSCLVRWSPMGYPIVPHVAKSWEVTPDKREWTFYLRKGMKWSDGHPFTVDDILYWWEHEVKDEIIGFPVWMKVRGEKGDIIQIDSHTVKFIFPSPHSLLLERLATTLEFFSPRHYLEPYHPQLGDNELIEGMMRVNKITTKDALYFTLKLSNNPEHPRIWPWVYRTYKPNPPQTFVRNPYYYAVDSQGNQLPYVDRFTVEVKTERLVPIAASNGSITMQGFNIYYFHYTLFMSHRDKGNYDVYHWYTSGSSDWALYPNLDRYIDPDDPKTRNKWELLNNKRFRQALSLAINRQQIIDAVYHGYGEPSQNSPGKESPFYHEKLKNSYIEYDPERANQMLDEIGLTGRDSEGFRTFKDGTRMTWYLNMIPNFSEGPSSFVANDWKKVGINTIEKVRSYNLHIAEQPARKLDFHIWGVEGEYQPLVSTNRFIPGHIEAAGYMLWYQDGGLYGEPESKRPGRTEPPPGHPLRRSMELLDSAYSALTFEEQVKFYSEIQDIAAENIWNINISTPPPSIVIVKKDFRNVPRKAIYGSLYKSPSSCGFETFFFENPKDSPGAIAQIKREITEIGPSPYSTDRIYAETGSGEILSWLIRLFCYGIVVVGLILVGVKHPYVGRRFLIMVPTLLVISVIAFTIIQLPPGNFIDIKILQAELTNDQKAITEAQQLRELFPLDRHIVYQYAHWLGLPWFLSFKPADQGLLQGHMGFSMHNRKPVNEVVGDRILLTFLISLGSVLFTWAVALPIGIYSAVRQYSIGDYFFTLLGFIGMCVPSFLLAILLMYWSNVYFGISMSGLFSSEYATQPEWSWGKVVDLLQHIWMPVVVLGVTGTASMIRVMRGNLLDELKKPYVITAMAKGVRPFKLLLKYPVRIALNPFISGIGTLFPQLVSGGAIVAMVLSLPTVGPIMLEALMTEDMYLAGSMLMVLSLLGVFGTLVSDLLLMWLDPRIRMEAGVR